MLHSNILVVWMKLFQAPAPMIAKKYWKYFCSLVNMNKESDIIPILKSNENNVEMFHDTDMEKAECLNP